jgi:hypothetical protein
MRETLPFRAPLQYNIISDGSYPFLLGGKPGNTAVHIHLVINEEALANRSLPTKHFSRRRLACNVKRPSTLASESFSNL